MTRHEELFDEISGEHMAELLERTERRGTVLRRRAVAMRAALAALVIGAVAVPLGLSLSHQQAPLSDNAVAITSGTAFQDVVWKDVHYPGLNFSKVTFPGNIGCNAGIGVRLYCRGSAGVLRQVSTGYSDRARLGEVRCRHPDPEFALHVHR